MQLFKFSFLAFFGLTLSLTVMANEDFYANCRRPMMLLAKHLAAHPETQREDELIKEISKLAAADKPPVALLVSWLAVGKVLDISKFTKIHTAASESNIKSVEALGSQIRTESNHQEVLLTTMGFNGASYGLQNFIDKLKGQGLAFKLLFRHDTLDSAASFEAVNSVSDVQNVVSKVKKQTSSMILVNDLRTQKFVAAVDRKTFESFRLGHPLKAAVHDITSAHLVSEWPHVVEQTSALLTGAIFRIDSDFYLVPQSLVSEIQGELSLRKQASEYFESESSSKHTPVLASAKQTHSLQPAEEILVDAPDQPQGVEVNLANVKPYEKIHFLTMTRFKNTREGGFSANYPVKVVTQEGDPVILAFPPTISKKSSQELEAIISKLLDLKAPARPNLKVIEAIRNLNTEPLEFSKREAIQGFANPEFPLTAYMKEYVAGDTPQVLYGRSFYKRGTSNAIMVIVPLRALYGQKPSQLITESSQVLSQPEAKPEQKIDEQVIVPKIDLAPTMSLKELRENHFVFPGTPGTGLFTATRHVVTIGREGAAEMVALDPKIMKPGNPLVLKQIISRALNLGDKEINPQLITSLRTHTYESDHAPRGTEGSRAYHLGKSLRTGGAEYDAIYYRFIRGKSPILLTEQDLVPAKQPIPAMVLVPLEFVTNLNGTTKLDQHQLSLAPEINQAKDPHPQQPSTVQLSPRVQDDTSVTPSITVTELRYRGVYYFGRNGTLRLSSTRPLVVIEGRMGRSLVAISPALVPNHSSGQIRKILSDSLGVTIEELNPDIITTLDPYKLRSNPKVRIVTAAQMGAKDFDYPAFVDDLVTNHGTVLVTRGNAELTDLGAGLFILAPLDLIMKSPKQELSPERAARGEAVEQRTHNPDLAMDDMEKLQTLLADPNVAKSAYQSEYRILLPVIKDSLSNPAYFEAASIIFSNNAILDTFLKNHGEDFKSGNEPWLRMLIKIVETIKGESLSTPAAQSPPATTIATPANPSQLEEESQRNAMIRFQHHFLSNSKLDVPIAKGRFLFTKNVIKDLDFHRNDKDFYDAASRAFADFALGKNEGFKPRAGANLRIIPILSEKKEKVHIFVSIGSKHRIIFLGTCFEGDGYATSQKYDEMLAQAAQEFPEASIDGF